MNDTNSKTNPLIVIAATAVILTCLLAAGVMTGLVPSPMTKNAAPQEELSTGPDAKAPAVSSSATTTTTRETKQTARAPAPVTRSETRSPAAERPHVGTTQSTGPSSTVAGSSPARAPACLNCGTVSSVRTVKEQGTASMIGPAAGGLLGGVLGHQVGGGTGKTIATIAGAAVGAGVGTEVERRTKSTTHYVVAVRLNDGTSQSFNYDTPPGVQSGDRIRVVDGRLLHD
ncbi:MAG TPA: glycine zipper 2TM domain-containing protein [Burkholderiales bacterium]|jgi:outer membrane lipoprotein SlyB|nr:glycine zipper 2TM domain-containing protein [Burkholderiales bacterium]